MEIRDGERCVQRLKALGQVTPLVTALAAACGALACSDATAAGRQTLEINGSTTVNPIVSRAAEVLREERGFRIRVDVLGGSSGGISQVAAGRVQVGTSSRSLTDEDLRRWPDADLRATRLGVDAVALAVSRPVWEGGVRSVTRAQAVALFEGRITSWAELGGPDLPVFVYDKEPGRGTREVFERWAWPGRVPPAVSFTHYAQVGGNEEGAQKTAAHGSAVTLLSSAWVARHAGLEALSLRVDAGGVTRAVAPTTADITSGSYPLIRPLLAITCGEPRGPARAMMEFLLGPRGQTIVRAAGYLANEDLAVEPDFDSTGTR